jgi:hypothetical protein
MFSPAYDLLNVLFIEIIYRGGRLTSVNRPQKSVWEFIENRHETAGNLTNAETILHLA